MDRAFLCCPSLFCALSAWHSTCGMFDAQRMFVERMNLCLGTRCACQCVSACVWLTCMYTRVYRHSPSSSLVEKGWGSWVAPLLRNDSTSCNLRAGPLVDPPTQSLPSAQLLAGRGLARLASVYSFCGGVTIGDKEGWDGVGSGRGEVSDYSY